MVASAAVSIATGWSDPVPGRELHPLKSSAFHGARDIAIFQQLAPVDCHISLRVNDCAAGVRGCPAMDNQRSCDQEAVDRNPVNNIAEITMLDHDSASERQIIRRQILINPALCSEQGSVARSCGARIR
jgi:hypothetical protein